MHGRGIQGMGMAGGDGARAGREGPRDCRWVAEREGGSVGRGGVGMHVWREGGGMRGGAGRGQAFQHRHALWNWARWVECVGMACESAAWCGASPQRREVRLKAFCGDHVRFTTCVFLWRRRNGGVGSTPSTLVVRA